MGSGPVVSVVVCTSGRLDLLKVTLTSIIENDHDDFEVVVVDQSHPDARAAVESMAESSGARYILSATSGNGAARNEGWAAATGEVLLYTDDDCEVPPDWIPKMLAPFAADDGVGVVFCNVVAGPHDSNAGYVPAYERDGSMTVRTLAQKRKARGIGAGLAVRRQVLDDIGGFDELLGPGARFHSCVDGDLAVRALLANWFVYETDSTAVIHHGFRTWEQGRSASRRTYYGIGAAYAKPLKRGRWQIVPVLAVEGWVAVRKPMVDIAHLRRPSGLSQPVYLIRGLCAGFTTPVDRDTLRFADRQSERH